MLNTGIEVEARPAGKKVKRLSLLSGGERSLVAVAFLVALFKARPSPFYILDEVEAALDDTNLGRLLEIYEELRENSQLLVITHQKRTMEVGDALYGVTMRGDGVYDRDQPASPRAGVGLTPPGDARCTTNRPRWAGRSSRSWSLSTYSSMTSSSLRSSSSTSSWVRCSRNDACVASASGPPAIASGRAAATGAKRTSGSWPESGSLSHQVRPVAAYGFSRAPLWPVRTGAGSRNPASTSSRTWGRTVPGLAAEPVGELLVGEPVHRAQPQDLLAHLVGQRLGLEGGGLPAAVLGGAHGQQFRTTTIDLRSSNRCGIVPSMQASTLGGGFWRLWTGLGTLQPGRRGLQGRRCRWWR